MDIKTLSTFIAVAKHKNFSSAAKELFSVQPTVSRRISDLENELSVKLFLRSTHQVKLTAVGEWFLSEAIDIVANEQRVKKQIIEIENKQVDELNIGYLATACSFFLPGLLSQYMAEHLGLNTQLREMTGKQQSAALIEKDIDIGFSRTQPNLDGNLFHVRELYSDQLVAVLPLFHPLAGAKKVSIKQISKERFLIFERALWEPTFDQILTAFQRNGLAINITHNPENMRHLVTSVSSGLGISIAPSCIQFIAKQSCVCIPIIELSQALPLYIYYRHQDDKPYISDFVQFCLDTSEDIQAQFD